MLGQQRRVVDEDGVGVVGQRRVVVDHLHTRAEQSVDEGIVLFLGQRQVRLVGVVPARRIGRAESRVRPPHKDTLQGGEHGVEHGVVVSRALHS